MERATGIPLERHPSYVSLSGLFLHVLERLPDVGDSIPVRSGDWQMEVLSLERRRVGTAPVSPAPSDERQPR